MKPLTAAATAKTHLSLNVSDIDRSVRFYEAFFGRPVHKRREDYANFDLADPPLKLSLEQRSEEAESLFHAGALNHLGIQVARPSQVEAARKRLIDAGLATFDERDVTCCYALQDKVCVTDPDGNRWEVYVLLDELEESELAERTAPCCE
jgi:catechol 2,3-dioxygenase-like lactoylglutathione lyase family enzyme